MLKEGGVGELKGSESNVCNANHIQSGNVSHRNGAFNWSCWKTRLAHSEEVIYRIKTFASGSTIVRRARAERNDTHKVTLCEIIIKTFLQIDDCTQLCFGVTYIFYSISI